MKLTDLKQEDDQNLTTPKLNVVC